MTRWESILQDTFVEMKDALGLVLQAQGCREGWLQGELFRRLRERGVQTATNTVTLPSPVGKQNLKADLSIHSSDRADAQLQLVGEIKVFGEQGYANKNLTGSSLVDVRRRLARSANSLVFRDCAQDRRLVMGAGLLADYFRLRDFDSSDNCVRVLVLCVQKSSDPDVFGQVLRRIEFERFVPPLCETDQFWVKCWTVGDGT